MKSTRLLVVGAGSAGRMAASKMLAHPEAGFVPVAFIDDDPSKQGTTLEGLPVLGGRDIIPRAVADHEVDEILIALPSAHGQVVRDIISTCRSLRLGFKIVPGIWEIIRGDVHIQQIRGIEPEDLLGRESVEPDTGLLESVYRGRRVLVTGAGGSIGRELARQVLAMEPERLVLTGRGENSLFDTDVELRRLGGRAGSELALVDLRDREAMRRCIGEVKPHVVLHAAAHKHVTFMEYYPEEAILNNVIGTRDLVDAVTEHGVERLVMLSTDKAVNPRSVMGASKRVAELILQHHTGAGSSTRLMAVRFGNVLGSRGSVVPLFLKQIAAGGPVTVSHPEVARFFMTVKEAAMLVLKAGAMGRGGETFILDMGDQIPIIDLARDLIVLSGYRPDEDIAITIAGLESGEKLREELVHDFETLEPTAAEKVRVAVSEKGHADTLGSILPRLEEAARTADRIAIRDLLHELLPEAQLPPHREGRV